MSDDYATRRKAAYEKGNASIKATVQAYLKTVNRGVLTEAGQMYAEDADPVNFQRDVIYLLIQKERLYIEALRSLTADWHGKSVSQMPPAILQAMALVQSYEQTVEGKAQPADSEANDGQ